MTFEFFVPFVDMAAPDGSWFGVTASVEFDFGTDFIGWCEFEPGRLILRPQPKSTTPLVWERLPEG